MHLYLKSNYNLNLISISAFNNSIVKINSVFRGTSNDILIGLWKETQGNLIGLNMNTPAVSKGKYIVPNIPSGIAISNVVQSAYDENKTGMFLYQRLSEQGSTRFVSLHDMAKSKYYEEDGKTCFKLHNRYIDKSVITDPGGTVGSCDNFRLLSYNDNYTQKIAGGLWGKKVNQFELDQSKKTTLESIERTEIDSPSYKISQMLYDNGAKEIHVRIASPEIKYPDFYGVDTPTKKELLAANKSVDEIKEFIKAKSLKFLTLDGLYRGMGFEKRNDAYPQLTDHHFTGDYPVKIIDELGEDKVTQLSLLSTGSTN